MKKTILASIGALFLFSGCATGPVAGAFTFTKHSTGGDAGVALDVSASESKTGSSACRGILGLISFGDCSVDAAAKDGGISKVKSVTHDTTNILYFYSSYTTTVKGE